MENMTKKKLQTIINRFKKNCRTSTFTTNRLVKAYRIPGTPEHGQLEMYQHMLKDFDQTVN